MKHVVRYLGASMLALAACAVETPEPPADPGRSELPVERAITDPAVDPNICAPGPWAVCNGLLIGEVCGVQPFRRCFPWSEVGDGSYICSCSTEPEG